MHNNYSDSFIKKVLEDANSIAIVGASPNKERDSHKVMKYLLEKGYEIFPVNPKESGNMILGQYCFDDLESINKPVDMVDVFRATEALMGIAEQSISIGAKVLWTQENIVNKEAAKNNLAELERINGKTRTGKRRFATGGVVSESSDNSTSSVNEALIEALSKPVRAYVTTQDLQKSESERNALSRKTSY